MTVVSGKTCPNCSRPIPVETGFVAWCDRCGWNLAPPEEARDTSRRGRLYQAAGRRLGDRLARELLAAGSLEPRLTPAKAGAYAIAAVVLVLPAVFVVAGALLAVRGFPNPFALIAAALLIGMAWVMRPRFGKEPDEDVVAPSDTPELRRLIDDVARALDTRSIDTLVVDHRFNASWSVVTLRRRRVLALGLPLLEAIGPQGRVALIAHELAHGRNSDAGRGLVVGTAIDSLADLYYVFAPEDMSGFMGHRYGFIERGVNLFFRVISKPLWWLLMLELHLVLRDHQRAEYLADALAARAAGTDGAVELTEALLLRPTVEAAVQRTSHAGRDADLFADLQHTIAALPDRERERRRRAARLEPTVLDASHPPVARRLELLEGRPRAEPLVVVDAARAAAIDAELARFRRRVQQRLVEDHRDRLYA